MLSIFDIQEIVSDSFFDGNMEIAGMVMYALILIALFALSRKTTQTLILSLPVTLIFSFVGVLPVDVTVLLIVVTVLALAFTARKVWSD